MLKNKSSSNGLVNFLAKITVSLLVFLFIFQTPLLVLAQEENQSAPIGSSGSSQNVVIPSLEKQPTFSPLPGVPGAETEVPVSSAPPTASPAPRKIPVAGTSKPTEVKPKAIVPVQKPEKEMDGEGDSLPDLPVENPNTIKSLLPDVDTLTGSLTYT